MHISPLFKRLFIFLTAFVCLAPIAVILLSLTSFDEEIWSHLLEYQLFDVIKNTLYLIFGVGLGVGLLGTSLAWLTATYEFPLKRFRDCHADGVCGSDEGNAHHLNDASF